MIDWYKVKDFLETATYIVAIVLGLKEIFNKKDKG